MVSVVRLASIAGWSAPPAICFLDLTGYTRLTEERGDEAAAELAETMSRIVQRTSTSCGGRGPSSGWGRVMVYSLGRGRA